MKNTKMIFSILCLGTLLFSCERNTETEGPLLLDLYADFEFVEELEISKKSVDFTKETAVFNAKFNKQTTWELRIKGLESHAEKLIS